MTNETRFAYVQIHIDGTQALNFGDLVSPGSLTSPPAVTWLGPSGQDAGANPTAHGLGGAQTYSSLIPSLDNAYLAVSTEEKGIGFVDLNNYILSMTDLSQLCMVNDQTFAHLNKSNCNSPAFDNWINQQLSKASGPAEIASIESDDFEVLSLASENAQVGPVWTRQNTFYLGYGLNIRSHTWSGTDTFIMEFDVQGAMLGQVSAVPKFQRAEDLFGIHQVGSQQRVTYDGRDVVSTRHSLTGGTIFTLPLSAVRVAGYQPLVSAMNRAPHHPPVRKPLPHVVPRRPQA